MLPLHPTGLGSTPEQPLVGQIPVGQPHPQCTAQGGPTGDTPGPEAPVAGMILPRTSWFLPQRCLGGVLVLLPCSSRRADTVHGRGDANQGPAKMKTEREELLELVLLTVYGRIWPPDQAAGPPTAPGQGWQCRQGDNSLCWWPLVCPRAVGFPGHFPGCLVGSEGHAARAPLCLCWGCACRVLTGK